MNDQHPVTPVALYARVSSDRQDVDLSIAAQLRALRDYAQKNGYIVFREYVDEAESGRIADRPEFRKMIDAAAKANAPFQEILVWKFSRFTRKREHAVAFKSMLMYRTRCDHPRQLRRCWHISEVRRVHSIDSASGCHSLMWHSLSLSLIALAGR